MGIEEGMQNLEETAAGSTNETPDQIRVRQIHEEMQGQGLSSHHARNILSVVYFGLHVGDMANLMPAERYDDRVGREARELKKIEDGELYMQLSDPEAVAEFNALVDSFNSDVERIKRERDLKAGEDFLARALEILRKYNS